MRKYKVIIPCDYVQGYLRHGHYEGVVEVENKERLDELIESKDIVDKLDLEITDYSVEDNYIDWSGLEVEEIKE